MSSARDYAILWFGAKLAGSGVAALGGNALLTTRQHRLDGPEHLTAADTTALDATDLAHGLMPKLSGDVDDVFHGDGSQAPLDHGSLGGLADDDHPQYATDADLAAALASFSLTKRWEPHVDYTGSVVLDGNGDPVMVEVAI